MCVQHAMSLGVISLAVADAVLPFLLQAPDLLYPAHVCPYHLHWTYQLADIQGCDMVLQSLTGVQPISVIILVPSAYHCTSNIPPVSPLDKGTLWTDV